MRPWFGADSSLVFSAEFAFLVVVISSYIYHIIILDSMRDPQVHQFQDFEHLIKAIIICDNNVKPDPGVAKLAREAGPLDGGHGREIIDNAEQNATESIPICPIDGDRLKNLDSDNLNTWLNYRHIKVGGHFQPIGCRARQKVAIVVPYRDREDQLKRLTQYLHQFLPDQLIEYTVYVVEQANQRPFNRAKLFNVGAGQISKLDPGVCCFIFHDVDMMPLDQKNLYMCSDRPRHMSAGTSTLRFQLLSDSLFGGVVAMTKDHYKAIGGFSNSYSGWGGEDDDMFRRFKMANIGIQRSPFKNALYMMLVHPKVEPNPDRFKLLDGLELNSTGDGSYTLLQINHTPLYTHMLVEI